MKMSERRRYTDDELNDIFERGGGKCHLCGVRVAFKNYNKRGKHRAWHVDHSRPLANGGTDHGNNLRPAHIDCNLEKGTFTSRTVRAWNGRKKAPLSKRRREKEKTKNAIGAGALGTGVGALFGGPPGALLGGLLGAAIGHDIDPDEE